MTSFLVFYEDDFESKHLLESELELWQHYWLKVKTNCPSNISNTLKALKFDAFPNIKIALKILATLPITSCECERSFSGLRRVKTHTRTTMSGERLYSLSVVHFHSDKFPDIERVINNFASMSKSRLELNI